MTDNKAHQGIEEILCSKQKRAPAYQGLSRRTAVELQISSSQLSEASQ